MSLRTITVFSLVALFGLVQTLGSAGMLMSESIAYAHAVPSTGDAGDFLKEKKKDDKDKKDKNDNKDEKDDDEDEDEDDCSGNAKDDASGVTTSSSALAGASTTDRSEMMLKEKKKDDKDKKDKNDNKDEKDDDEDEDEDGCSGNEKGDDASGVTTPATMPTGTLPMTEVTGTSTGGDSMVALVDERVVLRIFSWTPSGITFKMRFVDPASVIAPPGKRAGNMVFRIEAQDAAGQVLEMLPAEVNVSARYADRDVAGSSEQNVTLSRLDPTDNKWKAAPKLTRAADNNYVAASIMEPGTYAIHIP